MRRNSQKNTRKADNTNSNNKPPKMIDNPTHKVAAMSSLILGKHIDSKLHNPVDPYGKTSDIRTSFMLGDKTAAVTNSQNVLLKTDDEMDKKGNIIRVKLPPISASGRRGNRSKSRKNSKRNKNRTGNTKSKSIISANGFTLTNKEIVELHNYFSKLSGGDDIITINSFNKAFSDMDFMMRDTASLFQYLDVKNHGKVTFQVFMKKFYPNLDLKNLRLISDWVCFLFFTKMIRYKRENWKKLILMI